MAFAVDSRRMLAAFAAVLATAVLAYFGNGLNPAWPLMWIAPLPVLLVAARNSWWSALIVAFFSWSLGALSMWTYFHRLSIPWAPVAVIVALVFTAAVLLFRALLRFGSAWGALLAFPALWVSAEFLNSRFTPDGTAGSLSYTQLKFLPFLQLASLTGPWGMSFLLLLFPAALAIAFDLRRSDPRQAVRVAGATLALLALALVYGTVRLAIPAPRQQLTVGLAASDAPGYSGVAAPGAPTLRLLRAYAAHAEILAGKGAKLIVLPEHLGELTGHDLASADTLFQSLADHTGSTIVLGISQVSARAAYNQARVYQPQFPILTYDKEHLLAPFESMFTPGKSLTTILRPTGLWGVAICKDLDFKNPARIYGEAGVGLLLAPAWDFDMDRAFHGHIAIMRGVEDGFSLVRAARHGYLTVSDDRGRILAETRSDSAPFAMLVATVPTVHNTTLYLLWGDWFGWVAVSLLGLTLVWAALLSALAVRSRAPQPSRTVRR